MNISNTEIPIEEIENWLNEENHYQRKRGLKFSREINSLVNTVDVWPLM